MGGEKQRNCLVCPTVLGVQARPRVLPFSVRQGRAISAEACGKEGWRSGGRAGGSSICKGPEGVLPGASRLTEEAAWGAEVLWGVRDHRLTQGLCGKGRRGAPAAFERRRDGGRCTFLMLSLMAGTSAACELGSLEVSVHRGRS